MLPDFGVWCIYQYQISPLFFDQKNRFYKHDNFQAYQLKYEDENGLWCNGLLEANINNHCLPKNCTVFSEATHFSSNANFYLCCGHPAIVGDNKV